MIKLPIYFGFNHQEPIGHIVLDDELLPDSPMWNISPAYETDGRGNYTITSMGLVPQMAKMQPKWAR